MTSLPAPEQTLMYQEAQESAQRVAHQLLANQAGITQLAQELRSHPPRFVVTSARGSSDHAATFAKYVFETQLGYATSSASPSVSSVYAAPQKLEGALYLAISQSGKSPDLLRQARAARDAGARVVALVNAQGSPLADIAHTLIPLHAGPENSVAATKSYICSLSAIVHIAALWKGDATLLAALSNVPDALAQTWKLDWTPLVDGLTGARNLFVVARGLGLQQRRSRAQAQKPGLRRGVQRGGGQARPDDAGRNGLSCAVLHPGRRHAWDDAGARRRVPQPRRARLDGSLASRHH